MLVRKIDDITSSDKVLTYKTDTGGLRSVRLLTKDDQCGFSVADVRVQGEWSIDLHYKNHVEINYIVSGKGKIEDLSSGESWEIGPGSLYVVGPKDRHRMTTEGDAHLVSIFNPAVTGSEKHDADDSYEPTGEIPAAWAGEAGRTMFVMQEDGAKKLVIAGGKASATRYVNRAEGCGLSFSIPRAPAGSEVVLWYKNHVEANYVFEGEGTVEDLGTGESWEVGPGTLFVVGPKDRHRVTIKKDLYAMSVFNPALVGNENHDADGAYAPSGDIPPAWRA